MGYRELNEVVDSLPHSFREELRNMVRIRNFNQQDAFKLFQIIQSYTIFDDLFDHINKLTDFQEEIDELQLQLEEMPEIYKENKQQKDEIERLKKQIEILKEKPAIRAKRVRNYVNSFYDSYNRYPTFDEVWTQATLEMEEKYKMICDQYGICARTQFCREEGETCFEKKINE